MNIADDLIRMRKSAKITQKQMAEKIGVHRTAISQWEKGVNIPGADKYLLFCEICGAQIDVKKECQAAKQKRDMFLAYIDAGFTEKQALELIK